MSQNKCLSPSTDNRPATERTLGSGERIVELGAFGIKRPNGRFIAHLSDSVIASYNAKPERHHACVRSTNGTDGWHQALDDLDGRQIFATINQVSAEIRDGVQFLIGVMMPIGPMKEFDEALLDQTQELKFGIRAIGGFTVTKDGNPEFHVTQLFGFDLIS